MMLFAVISSLTGTLIEQCTYLGYLLLEAPRKYVQHGPLVSINWLRLCPQSGARVWSHAIRRRLFIVLMTAAHISPNVFSLRNYIGHIHVLFLAYILIIHHIQAIFTSFYYETNHSIISSAPPGRPTALGLPCPIQIGFMLSCARSILNAHRASSKSIQNKNDNLDEFGA